MSSQTTAGETTEGQVPLVNYLVLDDGDPHLEAQECEECGARYLERRVACARCGKRSFRERRLVSEGTIGSFSIIHRAAPGVPTPYVSALVDLEDGTTVKANVIGCAADPDTVRLGMAVRFRAFEVGSDAQGTVAIGFGYEPVVQPSAADTQGGVS